MNSEIDISSNWSITVEFDYADIGSESVLAILLNTNQKRFLLSWIDATSVGKSATVIEPSLKQHLALMPRDKLSAIVSDSASSCKFARDNISKERQRLREYY